VRAARAQDPRAVYARLTARERAQLGERADAATALAARRRTFAPWDLLSVGAVAPRWEPVRVREVSRQGDRAIVQLRGPAGQVQVIKAVREAGEWFVELP
jgi:hypothetical protein